MIDSQKVAALDTFDPQSSLLSREAFEQVRSRLLCHDSGAMLRFYSLSYTNKVLRTFFMAPYLLQPECSAAGLKWSRSLILNVFLFSAQKQGESKKSSTRSSKTSPVPSMLSLL